MGGSSGFARWHRIHIILAGLLQRICRTGTIAWVYLGRWVRLGACCEVQEAAAWSPSRRHPGLTAQHSSAHQEPDPGETSAASHHLPAQNSMSAVLQVLASSGGIKEGIWLQLQMNDMWPTQKMHAKEQSDCCSFSVCHCTHSAHRQE